MQRMRFRDHLQFPKDEILTFRYKDFSIIVLSGLCALYFFELVFYTAVLLIRNLLYDNLNSFLFCRIKPKFFKQYFDTWKSFSRVDGHLMMSNPISSLYSFLSFVMFRMTLHPCSCHEILKPILLNKFLTDEFTSFNEILIFQL